MESQFDLNHVADLARPAFAKLLEKYRRRRVRLLMVVDTEISLSPGANAFGIERVIRLLRETQVGSTRFVVDVGQRSSAPFSVVAAPTGTTAKYLGFRFDSVMPDGRRVIDHYDEVWCFGFKPDNLGQTDANITQPGALATGDSELIALTNWMNSTQGGVFATGDHDYLGASMCHRIPRVGTMRAWTNAQGVPPVNTALRIDTNRPFDAAEAAGTAVIEFARQSDTLPQPIEWVPWMSFGHPWLTPARHTRPHPVLCHPTLGPINVMPDHPHEGVVFDHVSQPDVSLAPITLGSPLPAGLVGDEYPTVGGVRPLPMVIAHGHTLADPPLMQEKGDSPAKRFGMISVYDGHRANVGRVATDSTWHHWMNINIAELEAAGGANWEKIKRYYINLAVWLAPPPVWRDCFHLHLLESFYVYPGIEEFRPRADLVELGTSLRERLSKLYGPCWVTQFVFDWVGRLDFQLGERLMERYLAVPMPNRPFPPRPSPSLTCPPPDLIEKVILGSAVRVAWTSLFEGAHTLDETTKRMGDIDPDRLDKDLLAGSVVGLRELQGHYAASAKQTKELLDRAV